jgi:hypothetical protein
MPRHPVMSDFSPGVTRGTKKDMARLAKSQFFYRISIFAVTKKLERENHADRASEMSTTTCAIIKRGCL